MTDQGWIVDDGTCDECVRRLHYRCGKPQELEWDDPGVHLACCCDEFYDLGGVAPDEAVEP